MAQRQPGFLRPGIELLLDLPQILFRARRLCDLDPAIAQTRDHIVRGDETILANEAQEKLARAPAETRAAFGKELEQSDLVGRRPLRQELPKAAVLARNLGHERCVVANGFDLLRVAHDALVTRKLLPE